MKRKRCTKRKFRDRVAAELALAKIAWTDNTRRADREIRSYFCPTCRAHHLTHQEEKK